MPKHSYMLIILLLYLIAFAFFFVELLKNENLISRELYFVSFTVIVFFCHPILRYFTDLPGLSGIDEFRSDVHSYLKLVLKNSSQFSQMKGAKVPGSGQEYNFTDLYCDLSTYSLDNTFYSLSELVSKSPIGEKKFGCLLLGPPGSGKSATLQALALSFANASFFSNLFHNNVFGGTGSKSWKNVLNFLRKKLYLLIESSWLFECHPYIPIFINLSEYNECYVDFLKDKKPEKKFLEEILEKKGFSMATFNDLANRGRLAILCDGLDEISSITNKKFIFRFAKYIYERSSESKNFIMITCREEAYKAYLRELKPINFCEIKVGVLNQRDRKNIVEKIVQTGLKGKAGSGIKNKAVSMWRHRKKIIEQSHYKPKRYMYNDLINDLVYGIMNIMPVEQGEWHPTWYPLSLRRFTIVVLSKTESFLEIVFSEKKGRFTWRLNKYASELITDYSLVIEEDLKDLLSRRFLFKRLTGLQDDEILNCFGNIGLVIIKEDKVEEGAILEIIEDLGSNKNASNTELLNGFLEFGILTERISINKKVYVFRDEESRNFTIAHYLLNTNNFIVRIDKLIREMGLDKDMYIITRLIFHRLRSDKFQAFMETSETIGNPLILYSLISGLTGASEDSRISKREATSILKRCFIEITMGDESNGYFYFQLIRHILFNLRYDLIDTDELISYLGSGEINGNNLGQLLLITSEMEIWRPCNRNLLIEVLKGLLDSDDVFVRACAAKAYSIFDTNFWKVMFNSDALNAIIKAGKYDVGDYYSVDNPFVKDVNIKSFKIARFPLTTHDYFMLTNQPIIHIEPGNYFRPIIGIEPNKIEKFLSSHGARIPTSIEFDIASSYSSNTERHRYPWGNSLTNFEKQIAFETLSFRNKFLKKGTLKELIREDNIPDPIGLKPCLGNPDGIYDLVGNILQWTNTVPPVKIQSDSPELLIFGSPATGGFQEQLCCSDRTPGQSTKGSRHVGFRLAFDFDGE